ncbi:Cyclic nucleotide-binding domain-containing protein [Plasmodiophora brassicae]
MPLRPATVDIELGFDAPVKQKGQLNAQQDDRSGKDDDDQRDDLQSDDGTLADADEGTARALSYTGDRHVEGRSQDELLLLQKQMSTAATATSGVRRAPRWILLPDTTLHRAWSTLMFVVVLYTFVVIPWSIAFDPSTDTGPSASDIIIDVVFGLDIIVSFVTAYETRRGRLQTRPAAIALHYLCTWALPDLVSSFPLYLVLNQPGRYGAISFARLPRLLKLIKLLRVVKVTWTGQYRVGSTIAMRLEYNPFVHENVWRILRLFIFLMAFSHVAACIWYFIGQLYYETGDGPGQPWVVRTFTGGIAGTPTYYKYVLSLYWVTSTLATVGYGDITGQTPAELVFSIIVIIVGSTTFAYTTATAASMIGERDQRAQALRDKLSRLRTFAAAHHLSTRLRLALTKRMSRIWSQAVSSDTQLVADIMADLPSDLAQRCTAEMHHDLIQCSTIARLCQDSPTFILALFRCLVPIKVAAGQMLAVQGDPILHWYIIESGELRAVHCRYPTAITYAMYTAGQSIGEVAMYAHDVPGEHTTATQATTTMTQAPGFHTWRTSVRCHTNCRLWTTPAETFKRVVQQFALDQTFIAYARQQLRRLQDQMHLMERQVNLMDGRRHLADGASKTLPALGMGHHRVDGRHHKHTPVSCRRIFGDLHLTQDQQQQHQHLSPTSRYLPTSPRSSWQQADMDGALRRIEAALADLSASMRAIGPTAAVRPPLPANGNTDRQQ